MICDLHRWGATTKPTNQFLISFNMLVVLGQSQLELQSIRRVVHIWSKIESLKHHERTLQLFSGISFSILPKLLHNKLKMQENKMLKMKHLKLNWVFVLNIESFFENKIFSWENQTWKIERNIFMFWNVLKKKTSEIHHN